MRNKNSAVTRVNAVLKANGREERLVRGRGYYYLINYDGGRSGLYVFWLEPTEKDFQFALQYVRETLAYDGVIIPEVQHGN